MDQNNKRRSRTEAAFMKALIECANSLEYSEISISELAQKAGYSRRAFYAHFGSKELFLKKFFQDEVEQYVNYALQSSSANVDGVNGNDGALYLFSHVYDNQKLYSLLFSDNCFGYMQSQFVEEAITHIKKRVKIDLIGDTEFDQDLYLYLSVNSYISSIKYWIKTNFKHSPEFIAKQHELFRLQYPLIKMK